jgi:nanoRNase/pAp phosphatase (c-di-AMP/oligoRNAs hydrolase)
MSKDILSEPRHGILQKTIEAHADSFSDKDKLTILIFTHRQADPDALCSAAALQLLLRGSLGGRSFDCKIVTPQGVSLLGKHVASSFGLNFVEEIETRAILETDSIFVVDCGDPKLLEPYYAPFQNSTARKVLIDHHGSSSSPQTWGGSVDRIVSPSSTSTCEMITLGYSKELITKSIADILLTGLLFDSQHLGIASRNTLEAALILVDAGSDIASSKRILRHNPDRSEILGKIKAAQRVKYDEVAGKIIARSEISSFHASVARMLVEIGADVGIAYGETTGEARLSVRSSQTFFKETGIDLAQEAKKIASFFGLTGGGHSTAASVSGKTDPSALADRLVQNLKSILPQK